MPEIGKWNGMDQLSEKYYSTSPFAYVANNPISSFDVDGRWFNDDGSIDMSGTANSFVRTRSFRNQDFGEFRGQGGGGGMTIGNMMTGLGFEESGDMNYAIAAIGALSLRQQLIDAGWDNPENISAKFNDWYKLVSSKEIPALNELYRITKFPGFHQDETIGSSGVTNYNSILLNMSKNPNLLKLAFTIGHEMNHVFGNIFFKDTFDQITRTPPASTRSFSFFQETMGLNWEMKMGNSILCGFSGLESASYYYNAKNITGGYDQSIIDKVAPYYNVLKTAWDTMYLQHLQKIQKK